MSLSTSFANVALPAVLGVSIIAAGIGYSDAKGAEKVLSEAGYTHIHVGKAGRENTNCNGTYRNSFQATAKDGRTVKGTVCQALGGNKKPEIALIKPEAPEKPKKAPEFAPVFIASFAS